MIFLLCLSYVIQYDTLYRSICVAANVITSFFLMAE